VHSDKGVADVNTGISLNLFDNDRFFEGLHGIGRQRTAGFRHGIDMDGPGAVGQGAVGLHHQGPVDVLAALDGQEDIGGFEHIKEGLHHRLGDGRAAAAANANPLNLAGAAPHNND